MSTLRVQEITSAGKLVREEVMQLASQHHITSPGVTTTKTESQGCPVQRRREHGDVK